MSGHSHTQVKRQLLINIERRYEDVCEILGLHKYARVQIELPFVQLGQIKAKLVPVNVPRTSRGKGQTGLSGEFLNPQCFLSASPFGPKEDYIIFGTSEELQRKALHAGDYQRGYDLIRSGIHEGADFYVYEWLKDLYDPVVCNAISDLVGLVIVWHQKYTN